MKNCLVVCIGNDLVADDGVGQAVYNSLVDISVSKGVRLEYLGLGGMDLIEQINGEDLLIVVDAVQLGADVGTVHILDWDQLPAMGPRPVSGHGIGIREAIEVSKRLYPERVPVEIYLVGIEGACFNQLGIEMTGEVKDAVPLAVRIVCDLLAQK